MKFSKYRRIYGWICHGYIEKKDGNRNAEGYLSYVEIGRLFW